MPFPQPSEYDDAIQNPGTAFTDAELQRGVNDGPLRFGMPGPVASGNFAVVYRFRCGSKRYAVKCFTRQPPKDQAQRFSSIHDHLLASRLSCTTEFQFLPSGIRVRGTLYPILKMEWLDAPTLLDFVPRNIQNREIFRQLSDSFLSVCAELRTKQIAHGDLQHGNLLVLGNRIKIIDYDGMCVPGTVGLPSEEDGLPHYQHPQRRGGNLSPHFDYFPSLVIWTSLHALSIDPGLWGRHVRDDERLLFKKDDFLNPQSSAVFRELLSYNDERLTKAVTALRDACEASDLSRVPLLNDVVHSVTFMSDPEWWRESQPVGASKVPAEAIAPSKHDKPDWMQPSLPAPLPERFGYSIIWDRIFAYTYVATVAVAWISVFMGIISVDTMIASVATLGGFLGIRMGVSFTESSVVKQKHRCAIRLKQARSELADYEAKIKKWKSDQELIIEKESRPVKDQETKLVYLQTQARQRQAECDAQLQRLLQGISTERQQIDSRERDALQAINQEMRKLESAHLERLRQLKSNILKAETDTTAQMDGLRRENEAKKEAQLKKIRDEKVRAELMRVPIRITSVESLTASNVRDLQNIGIHCAGDFIDSYSTTNYNTGYTVYLMVKADGSHIKVPGIGEKRANALLQWRREQVQHALRRSPTSLPQFMIDAIERETESQRQDVTRKATAEKTETTRRWTEAQEIFGKRKSELASKETNVRQAMATTRGMLDKREEQARQNTEAQKSEALSIINREVWQLQSVINPAKHKVDQLRDEYKKLIMETDRDHGEMRSTVSSIEREMLRFQNIHFRGYCARVFAFAGE
jgi:hypothetical protein